MLRKIIKINEEKCNGCGLCAAACHEGAIGMVDRKAKLLREDYCDGLGDCLPACPVEAISFEVREAAAYDEAAVLQAKHRNATSMSNRSTIDSQTAIDTPNTPLPCGCPGMSSKRIEHPNLPEEPLCDSAQAVSSISRLSQWPVQIKLVPITAPYFDDANLLIAADCTAYAYGRFHEDFIKNRIILIGCPKLDEGDYTEKLTAIIANNNIKSVTIVRMEVPCCSGIEQAAKRALQASGKFIPWRVVVITTDGRLLE